MRGGIWTGYYFTSMFVQDASYGFQNMIGPLFVATIQSNVQLVDLGFGVLISL